MNERSKSQSFLGADADNILSSCKAAIVGLGGGGAPTAQELAHIGVGQFVLFDPDTVEEKNLTRLVGARRNDARKARLKVLTASRMIHGINPDAKVTVVPKHWQESAELLRDCDVIFGPVDKFSERDQLERYARRYLVPYIDIGMDVHEVGGRFVIGGQVVVSVPGGLCLRCVGFLNEELLAREALNYGAAGGRPQVIWPNGVLVSSAVGAFMQMILPWHDGPLPTYLEYDGNSHTVNPSRKLQYLTGKVCQHFALPEDLGDPFWQPHAVPTQPFQAAGPIA